MNSYDTLPLCNSTLDRGHGYVRDLELTEREVRGLEMQGYIKNAVSPHGDTWKLTERGRKVRNLMLGHRTRQQKIGDWILKNLLRMHVTI